MISSKTLKNFVKMHEYKLNAKINRLRADKLDSELDEVHWGADCLDDRHQKTAARHWHGLQTEHSASDTEQRRPKSHYFNFILTV